LLSLSISRTEALTPPRPDVERLSALLEKVSGPRPKHTHGNEPTNQSCFGCARQNDEADLTIALHRAAPALLTYLRAVEGPP